MGVFPAASSKFLPSAWQNLMLNNVSKDYFAGICFSFFFFFFFHLYMYYYVLNLGLPCDRFLPIKF